MTTTRTDADGTTEATTIVQLSDRRPALTPRQVIAKPTPRPPRNNVCDLASICQSEDVTLQHVEHQAYIVAVGAALLERMIEACSERLAITSDIEQAQADVARAIKLGSERAMPKRDAMEVKP